MVNEINKDDSSSGGEDPFSPGKRTDLRKLNPSLSQSMFERQFYYKNTSIVKLSPEVDDFNRVTSGDSFPSSGYPNEQDVYYRASQVSLISDEGFGGKYQPNEKEKRPSDFAL